MFKTLSVDQFLRLICVALLYCCAPSVAFAKDETPGWILDQYSETLGPVQIFISQRDLKISQKLMGNTLVCSAPDWKVCQYNLHTKRQCFSNPQKYAAFSAGLAAISMGVNFSHLPMERQGDGSIFGIKTSVFTYGKSAKRLADKERFHRYMAMEGILTAKYQIAQSLKIPKVLEGLHARFFGVPEKDGVPLDLAYSDVEGRHLNYLSTKACRQTIFKDDEFALPKRYKSVASQSELTVREGESGSLNDMLEMTKSK
jgi:hypothetical protein